MLMRNCGLLALPVFLSMCACGGCGPSGVSVTGTVTYKGEPLTSGFVIFQPEQGSPLQAPIAADGSYQLAGVEPGQVAVAVTGPTKPVAGPDGVSADAPADGPQVYIPDRYGVLEKAGLSYTVTDAAPQVHDIALE